MAWLWKYGGMVLDTDLLILKPIYGLNSSYLVIENTDPGRVSFREFTKKNFKIFKIKIELKFTNL